MTLQESLTPRQARQQAESIVKAIEREFDRRRDDANALSSIDLALDRDRIYNLEQQVEQLTEKLEHYRSCLEDVAECLCAFERRINKLEDA